MGEADTSELECTTTSDVNSNTTSDDGTNATRDGQRSISSNAEDGTPIVMSNVIGINTMNGKPDESRDM